MAIGEALMTIEEFENLPDDGRVLELVKGRIVEVPPPGFQHGLFCVNLTFLVQSFLKAVPIGRIVSHDSGVITGRNPDSVRGPDLAFYSYARLASSLAPQSYPDVPPDLVIEVRSPSDRWKAIEEKIREYLKLGVLVVCLLEPASKSVRLFRADQPEQTFGPDDELTIPDCLGEFRVVVREFFETE